MNGDTLAIALAVLTLTLVLLDVVLPCPVAMYDEDDEP